MPRTKQKRWKTLPLEEWDSTDCAHWLERVGSTVGLQERFREYAKHMEEHHITGKCLPDLTQSDLRRMGVSSIGHQKMIMDSIKLTMIEQGEASFLIDFSLPSPDQMLGTLVMKLIVTVAYLFFSAFATSLVMFMVQYRVPDQYKYPPLPDIVLDSIPLIPWAFKVAEYILATLGTISASIVLLHKHRLII